VSVRSFLLDSVSSSIDIIIDFFKSGIDNVFFCDSASIDPNSIDEIFVYFSSFSSRFFLRVPRPVWGSTLPLFQQNPLGTVDTVNNGS
jgi:hypothetical protein